MNDTSVHIVPMAPSQYGVQIREGHTTTSHEVVLQPDVLDDLGLIDTEELAVVRETVAFLLDREPATAIMDRFGLEDVVGFFPEFYEELRDRLTMSG